MILNSHDEPSEIEFSVEDLIPHRSTMLFLDRVLQISLTEATCSIKSLPEELFWSEGRPLPAWYMIEQMAQAVGILTGYRVRESGRLIPESGYLVSLKDLIFFKDCPFGQARFAVSRLIHDSSPFMVAEGKVLSDLEGDSVLAEGRFTVFDPGAVEN